MPPSDQGRPVRPMRTPVDFLATPMPPMPVMIGPEQAVPHTGWTSALASVLANTLSYPCLIHVVGPPGVGKTLLLGMLVRLLSRSGMSCHFQSRGDGEIADPASVREAAGRFRVVLLDEAERIDSATIAAIREASVSTNAWVLASTSEYAETPDAPPYAGLRTTIVRLAPLAVSETRRYLDGRLARAGLSGELLSDDAVAELARRSAGVPRLLNMLVSAALFLAHIDKVSRVEVEHVAGAAALRNLDAVVEPAAASPRQIHADAGPLAAAPRPAEQSPAEFPVPEPAAATPADPVATRLTQRSADDWPVQDAIVMEPGQDPFSAVRQILAAPQVIDVVPERTARPAAATAVPASTRLVQAARAAETVINPRRRQRRRRRAIRIATFAAAAAAAAGYYCVSTGVIRADFAVPVIQPASRLMIDMMDAAGLSKPPPKALLPRNATQYSPPPAREPWTMPAVVAPAAPDDRTMPTQPASSVEKHSDIPDGPDGTPALVPPARLAGFTVVPMLREAARSQGRAADLVSTPESPVTPMLAVSRAEPVGVVPEPPSIMQPVAAPPVLATPADPEPLLHYGASFDHLPTLTAFQSIPGAPRPAFPPRSTAGDMESPERDVEAAGVSSRP